MSPFCLDFGLFTHPFWLFLDNIEITLSFNRNLIWLACTIGGRVCNVYFIMVLVYLSAPFEGHTLIVGLRVFYSAYWLVEIKTNVARILLKTLCRLLHVYELLRV